VFVPFTITIEQQRDRKNDPVKCLYTDDDKQAYFNPLFQIRYIIASSRSRTPFATRTFHLHDIIPQALPTHQSQEAFQTITASETKSTSRNMCLEYYKRWTCGHCSASTIHFCRVLDAKLLSHSEPCYTTEQIVNLSWLCAYCQDAKDNPKAAKPV
jgi:hypothetical protein